MRCDNSIPIICQFHGIFNQTPYHHVNRGQGCPFCKSSHLEKEVESFLKEKMIEYKRHKRFDWLGLQHLDFYLPKYNIAIECQGEQHYKPIDYFGGNDGFTSQKERDFVNSNYDDIKRVYSIWVCMNMRGKQYEPYPSDE